MGDLTTHDEAMIFLAEQAESFLQHKAREDAQGGASQSRDRYDATASRRQWADELDT